jgi:hypothetical protein
MVIPAINMDKSHEMAFHRYKIMPGSGMSHIILRIESCQYRTRPDKIRVKKSTIINLKTPSIRSFGVLKASIKPLILYFSP